MNIQIFWHTTGVQVDILCEMEMNQKLEQLKHEVHAGQDVAAERVVKKLKRDKGHEFKKKGHEKQSLFNDDIKDKLDSAAAMVAKVMPATAKDKELLDNTVKELKEGVEAILVRQKLIHLAGCSEFGWDAVNEYEADELASNEDDTKRLEKAEKAAEQKALKKKKAAYSRGGREDKGSMVLQWDSCHPRQVVLAVQCSR